MAETNRQLGCNVICAGSKVTVARAEEGANSEGLQVDRMEDAEHVDRGFSQM